MIMEDFQSRIPNNHCYGCGPGNAQGLRVKSYWTGDDVAECRFTPSVHHSAGPEHYLNGVCCAQSEVVAVRVPNQWKTARAGPRTDGWQKTSWLSNGKRHIQAGKEQFL